MRFAVNENVFPTVTKELRARGHDVLAAKETMEGAADEAILAAAQAEQRIVVTYDKDFGELAFRYGLPSECGVILIRLSEASREADIQRVLEVLESRQDLAGHFSVAEYGRIRMRPLPSAKQCKPK
jgi:predicted nuclease of predicted toxin-antitoxin system